MKYLFWAYTITWAIIFGYTLLLGVREKNLTRDLEMLKQALKGKL